MKLGALASACSVALAGPAVAAELRPTDPAGPAPSATYRSAFSDYKPFREEAVADWRALNSEVGLVGGHKGVMGGAGGHTGHGDATKPGVDVPVTTQGGQAPVRGAPKAPSGAGAHGTH